jgi:ribonuclease HI
LMNTKRKESVPEVIIYTDGGCEPNPGVGGWAAILLFGGHQKELYGGHPHTTNNRMEMTAAIKALEALNRRCKVLLHSDSQYLVTGISSWIHAWKHKNWMRGRKPVLNVDLWQSLDELNNRHEVTWVWVRGHVGNRFNEHCDQLAQKAILEQRAQIETS